MPEAENEILISSYLIKYLSDNNYGFMSGTVRETDFLNRTYKLFNSYGEQFSCALWNNINLYDFIGDEYTIVGIVESDNEQDNASIYVKESLYESLFNEYANYFNQQYYIIVDDDNVVNDLENLLSDGFNLDINDFYNVHYTIFCLNSIKIYLFAGIALMAVITVLILLRLSSKSLKDNRKNVFTLRTLGVSRSQIQKIFTTESACITIPAFLIGLILSIPAIFVINYFINNEMIEQLEGFYLIRMNPLAVICAGMICAVIVMIFGRISLVKNKDKIM